MDQGDLSSMKERIKSSPNLSPTEKEEWLFLLPKMNYEQISELEQILEIKIPAPADNSVPSSPDHLEKISPSPSTPSAAADFVQGIKKLVPWGKKTIPPVPSEADERPVSHVEISDEPPANTSIPKTPPDHSAFFNKLKTVLGPREKKILDSPAVPTEAPPAVPIAEPVFVPPPPPAEDAVPASVPLSLETASIEDLRREQSVYVFLEKLLDIARILSSQMGVTREALAEKFEKSPLFQEYLADGIRKLSEDQAGALSSGEFEAISDFLDKLKTV